MAKGQGLHIRRKRGERIAFFDAQGNRIGTIVVDSPVAELHASFDPNIRIEREELLKEPVNHGKN